MRRGRLKSQTAFVYLNVSDNALCRALQSLYKPITCNDHGNTSAPVPPSSLGRFGHGCTKSAGGLFAVGNGGVDD